MDKLIQTEKCSIIYGNYKARPDWPYQELFRCPRELDSTDLKRYVEENRCLLGFENDDTKDLRNVDGMELLDYWRMYFRSGWNGRWIGTTWGSYDETKITELDCHGVQEIIDWITDNFPHGCNWEMEDYMAENFKPTSNDGKRYFIKPLYSDLYKVLIDTTYGNDDYPIRIYVYKRKERNYDNP